MSPWLTFVAGIILGLLVGWLIDLLYKRRAGVREEVEPVAAPATSEWTVPLPGAGAAAPAAGGAAVVGGAIAARELEEPAGPLVVEHEQQPDWPEVSQRVSEVADTLEEEPPAAPHIADELPLEDQTLPPAAVAAIAASEAERGSVGPAADARDKLILIEGIGPVYEAKLNGAGIYTFAEMIAAGPERLRDIIQPQGWQRVNFGDWIEQAQLLDEGKTEELKALQARLNNRKKE